MIGGSGSNDFVNNQGGNTTIVGGGGTNSINLTPSGFVSLVDSGGLDSLNFSTTTTGISIDLGQSGGNSQNVDGAGFVVALTGTFENVVGTAFSDEVTGNGADNVIFGGLGSDLVDGGGGDDIIFGGTAAGADDADSSDDVIFGGLGTDQIDGGGGDDIIFGGTAAGSDDTDSSDDIIFGGLGADQVDGGGGDDIIFGGTAGTLSGGTDTDTSDDIIFGGLGNDQIDGGGGNDVIFGGTGGSFVGSADEDGGNDLIYGGLGSDQVDGGGGDDIIYGGTAARTGDSDSSDDIIYGGLGSDEIDAGGGDDIIFGGTAGGVEDSDASDDIIFGGLGSDQIDGGGGDDIIFGGTATSAQGQDADTNDDIIFGGLGSDQIDGGGGDDVIFGGTAAGTDDSDSGDDIIFGGLGADQVDAGGGDDIIFGGTGTPDADSGNGNDLIFGGTGNDVIHGGRGDDLLDGGAGDDNYVFGGTLLGSDIIVEEANVDTDTLNFSALGGNVILDLALTTSQTVNPGNLVLTISDSEGIENVVGSQYSDTLLGNDRDNQLWGANELDDRFADPAEWNGTTQWVFLDFDSSQSLLVGEDHEYTQAERDAIQARAEADYAGFHVEFTQTAPVDGTYATLFFNKTPVINGQPQPGGIADELDFRNLNLGGTAAIDVNTLLGGLNQPAATSDNIVAMSSTIAIHELGHLLGLRHLDSAGPVGFGLPATVGDDEFIPSYPGPRQAFESSLHLTTSPASVGSTLFDAVADPFFGEREAIKLAFAESGWVEMEQAGIHNSLATAQSLSLMSLAVPNTIINGINFGLDFAVAATAVVGSIGLENGESEDDFYAFAGRAGDLLSFQVYSDALTRISNPIDSILRIYDAAGNLLSYYDSPGENDDELEGLDSAFLDLILPADGTYFIQVDTFTDISLGVPDTDTGDYELLIYRFDAGNSTDSDDYLQGRGGNDTLIGGQGDDSLAGGEGSNHLDGGEGFDALIASGDVDFTLSDARLIGPGDDTLNRIESATLIGGASSNEFQLDGWTGIADVDGVGGVDTLAGPDIASQWRVTAAGAGTLNGVVAFGSMEVLAGGTGNDTLFGLDVENVWNLDGVNAGNLNSLAFTGMENLLGGSAGDRFVFAADAGVSGAIDGGAGVNSLDYAAYESAVVVDLGVGVATGSGGISNVQNVFGGAGDDLFTGNTAANIFVGNGGDDTLLGNGGRDIVIGGLGRDVLDGGDDDDILLGGVTLYDANAMALEAIMQEWSRIDAGYQQRVDRIQGTELGGLNGDFVFDDTTVIDDGRQSDQIWGRGGTDWFIYSSQDKLKDRVRGEVRTGI